MHAPNDVYPLVDLPVAPAATLGYLVAADPAAQRAHRVYLPEINAAATVVGDEIGRVVNQAGAQAGGLLDDLARESASVLAAAGYMVPVSFAQGLSVATSRFTVFHEGSAYAASPDKVPFVTSDDFDPSQWRLVEGVQAADLASNTGADLVRMRLAKPGASYVSVMSLMADVLNVRHAGARGNGSDDTLAFQRAIDWVIAMAESSRCPYAIPSIVIPGGHYRINETLLMKPWVHLVTDGPVLLDFTAIDPAKPGIVCSNNTSIPEDAAKFAGNHSPFLDGSRGVITILGPGKQTSSASGIRMGNFAPGLQPFRDARIASVVVTGWNAAQEFGNYDTYLCRTENSRLEQNNYGVLVNNATNTNSGERMDWSGCTIAGSTAAVMHNQAAMDLNFYGCSFDFNGDVLRLGASSSYCAIRFEHCYFEAFNNYVVDGAQLTTTAGNNQVAVMLSDAVILARGGDGGKGINSPSRTIFRGQFSLSIHGIKLRYETRPYLEDGALIAADTTVVAAHGYHIAPYHLPMRNSQIINDDFDFQRNADGTSGDELASWERTSGGMSGTISRNIVTVSGRRVLRLIGSTGANNSGITFRSRGKIECKPGEAFFSNVCINGGAATGNLLVQSRVEFYDSADQLLATLPSFTDYPLRTALNDMTVPNFEVGNGRWMDTNGFRAVAPKNTAYAKQNFYIGSFDGTVLISRARLWRG